MRWFRMNYYISDGPVDTRLCRFLISPSSWTLYVTHYFCLFLFHFLSFSVLCLHFRADKEVVCVLGFATDRACAAWIPFWCRSLPRYCRHFD